MNQNETPAHEKSFMLWWHYQMVIERRAFKNETHKNITLQAEAYWRMQWLIETEPFKDQVMINAGCLVIDKVRGLYTPSPQ
jgi:hypothetical protein